MVTGSRSQSRSTSCRHTTDLLARHLADLDRQIERLQAARDELALMAERAATLDPSACTDPNRCQVIAPVAGEPADH